MTNEFGTYKDYLYAKQELRNLSVTIRRDAINREYRVNLSRFSEATAYYTDSLYDALNTGIIMSQHPYTYRKIITAKDTPHHAS